MSSTNLEMGIVGLPNVGKSTLFNAITKAGAEAANYPFCTIEPNVGVVDVPDARLKVLADMFHSKKIVRVALHGEHSLGNAVAPHGAGGGPIGIDRVGVALHIGAGVQLWEGAHALGADRMAVRSVGSLIGEALDLPGHIGAVRPDV